MHPVLAAQCSTCEQAKEFKRAIEGQPQRQPETLLPPPGVTPPPTPPMPPRNRGDADADAEMDETPGEPEANGAASQADGDEVRRRPAPPAKKRGLREWFFGKPKAPQKLLSAR